MLKHYYTLVLFETVLDTLKKRKWFQNKTSTKIRRKKIAIFLKITNLLMIIVKICGESVHVNTILCIWCHYSVWVSSISASIGYQCAGRTSGNTRWTLHLGKQIETWSSPFNCLSEIWSSGILFHHDEWIVGVTNRTRKRAQDRALPPIRQVATARYEEVGHLG